MKWFPKRRKSIEELMKAADNEMQIVQYCAEYASENLHNFSESIQKLEKDVEIAAQAIRDAQEEGESKERIRTMKNDFRLLVRSLDKRERMRTDFQNICDLITAAYQDLGIMYDQGRYEEIVEMIPEKSLPYLIRSGDPADIIKLKNLLVKINKDLEERLASTTQILDDTLAAIEEEEATTDVMTSAASRLDKEMDALEARFNLGKSTDAADEEDDLDVRPVKVTKKATAAQKKSAQ